LLQRIEQCIPPEKAKEYEARKQKRLSRYNEYKQMLLDEIVDLR